MCALKTRPTDQDPEEFIESVEHKTRKSDGFELLRIMKEVTGEDAVMWGPSIIGFGKMKYTNTKGEAEWPRVGFSPRKRSLSVYVTYGLQGYEELLERLGKHRMGVGCIYINKLADIDTEVLKEIIKKSYEATLDA